MHAALIYQRATSDRDRKIADALSELVDTRRVEGESGTGDVDQGDGDGDDGAAGVLVPVA